MQAMQCGGEPNRDVIQPHHDGVGTFAKGRKRERVECGDCGQEMAAASLDSHRMSQHGRARERKWTWTEAATGSE